MRSSSRLSTSMLLLIGACANTCGGQTETATPSTPASAPFATQPAPATTAANAVSESRPAWRPAPYSELTRRLLEARATIESDRSFDGLASAAKLSDVLPAQLGDFSAGEEVASIEQHDGAAPLVAVARNYQHDTASARVKITDTARLPSARHALSSHLAMIGNEAAGGEYGTFVSGAPALLSRGDSYSRASALVSDRFLVQINVQDSADPNAAQSLLERLDWSPLRLEPADSPDPTH